jgi:hypothetical protein
VPTTRGIAANARSFFMGAFLFAIKKMEIHGKSQGYFT